MRGPLAPGTPIRGERRRRSAYHEAGHILVDVAFHHPPCAASLPQRVLPDGKEGWCTAVHRPFGWIRYRRRHRSAEMRAWSVIICHRQVRGSMAGYAAESIGFGLDPRAKPYRYKDVEDVLLARRWVAAAYPHPRREMREAFAYMVMLDEYERARRFLREHWWAVQRIARELLRRGRLGVVAIRRLVAEIFPRLRIPRFRLFKNFLDNARLPPGELPAVFDPRRRGRATV